MITWKGALLFLTNLTAVAVVCTLAFRGLQFPLRPTLSSPYVEVGADKSSRKNAFFL
jgi:uncharacterized membrane protein